ncbi:MAG: hypothetical protein RL456_2559 [Pseudomonadota bacterium]|jgi:hypothetical protein
MPAAGGGLSETVPAACPPPCAVHDGAIDRREAIRETLANIRAHSAIRFVALPFVIGALAVLAKTFHEAVEHRLVMALAGLILALCANIIEIVLSRNLMVWWHELTRLAAHDPWRAIHAHRDSKTALRCARAAFLAPYVGALGFWLYHVVFLMTRAERGAQAPVIEGACYLSAVGMLAMALAAWMVWNRAIPTR